MSAVPARISKNSKGFWPYVTSNFDWFLLGPLLNLVEKFILNV